MGTQFYFTDDLISTINRQISEGLTQRQIAKRLSISPAYLNDIIQGRREISQKVAKAMGFHRHTVFTIPTGRMKNA